LRPMVTSLSGLPSLVLGIVLILVGWLLLDGVGELSDRTEREIATVAAGNMLFTTLAGVDYVLPLPDTCKRSEPPPRRGCLKRYETGDEVLVWYDAADPTHTWEGSTPGGGLATIALYGGIVLVVLAFVTLYVGYVLPPLRIAGARMKGIAGRGSRADG